MAEAARVFVLMATHNGQEHLAEQLDSILSQEGVEITLRIADDCSTDSTYRILETYANEHENIELLYNSDSRGRTRSFLDLVYAAPADEYDYFALSNQGDCWHPEKLATGIARISANTSRPELYYAGVNAIDAQGHQLGRVLKDHEPCVSHTGTLLLARNWCLACTMIMNGALVKLLCRHPVFDIGRAHDAWIHAVALYCGGYVYADLMRSLVDARMERRDADAFASDELTQGEAMGLTMMAQALLREYARDMEPDTAKLVEAVAVRHVSAKARRFLFGRNDIMLPTNPRTSKLRCRILANLI